MTVRHQDPGGFPRFQEDGQEAAEVSVPPVTERVHLMRDVVEPLLRRSDLLAQLVGMGFPLGSRGGPQR